MEKTEKEREKIVFHWISMEKIVFHWISREKIVFQGITGGYGDRVRPLLPLLLLSCSRLLTPSARPFRPGTYVAHPAP